MQNDRLFFPFDDSDDMEERYDELLFEDKKFFSSKAIIPKVFRARMEKMLKRETAYRNVSGIPRQDRKVYLDIKNKNSSNLLENFLSFQEDKAIFFKGLYAAQDAVMLIDIVDHLLRRHSAYAQAWKLADLSETTEVLLSKEPDPSFLHDALVAFAQAGGQNVNELQTLHFLGQNLLLNEAKRLSLQLQNGIL